MTTQSVHLALVRAREDNQVDQAVARHPAGKKLDEQERALANAEKWAKQIVEARQGY